VWCHPFWEGQRNHLIDCSAPKSGETGSLANCWGEILKLDIIWLVVWNIYFTYILGKISPTDELIFFRGVETTNQLSSLYIMILDEHMGCKYMS